MNGITKETFKEADNDTKLDILFDYIQNIHKSQAKHPEKCNERFDRLENKGIKDTAFSAGFGLVGGFAAMAAKLKWWG